MSPNPDLGKTLSAARRALGSSIEDISRQTHIPEIAIRHLEKGQFSKFPSPEYAKGFLAQYSAHLGLSTLDEPNFLDTSDNGPGISSEERNYNRRLTRVAAAENRPLPITESRNTRRGLLRPRNQSEKDPREPQLHISKRQPLIVFMLTSILIACSLFAYMRLSADFGQEDPSSAQNPSQPLGAIGGLSAQTPSNPVFFNVPRALPVSKETSQPIAANDSVEGTNIQNLSASNVTPSVTFEGFSLENPPPRAVIVEE